MIKKYILKILLKVITFLNNNRKVKIQPKSPADFYLEEVAKDSYNQFKDHFKNSFIFTSDNSIREFAITEALKIFNNKNLFLEFGVYKGDSINLFAKKLRKINGKIFGFDSFQGLKDEWITEEYNPSGTFNLNKKKPKTLANVNLIEGWVEDTIGNFLDENMEKNIAFIHFDMDTYDSTSFVLEKIKNKIKKGTVILFDEFYGFPNWEKYEFKALKEKLNTSQFKYIAFSNRQACIQII
jgi:hypothetical protein